MNITSNNSKSKVVPKARTPQNGQTKEVYEAVKPPPAQTDQVGFRVRLESFLSGRVGTTIELVSLAVSILTVIAHITNTYIGGWIFRRFLYIDVAIMFFYFLEFLLQLYISQHKLLFFFSIYSFISISSFLPLTFVFYNLNELIYRITLVLRSIRIVRYLLKFFSTIKNEVSRQIYTIFLTVFSLILVTAGIIQVFEDDNQESIRNSDIQACIESQAPSLDYCDISDEHVYFHQMIYFVVVTLSTAGYGDIIMRTALAKLCVIVLLCLAVVLIPNQTSELIRLMAMQSAYARDAFNSTSDSTHVIICGNLSSDSVSNFCQELFHPDHGIRNLMAVILQKNPPSPEMLEVLQSPNYDVLLKYLQGDPLEEKNLKRAEATKASACIVLTDKYIKDPVAQDHKNILLGIAMKNHVANSNTKDNVPNKHVRICMQLVKPESKSHFLKFTKGDDQIIVVEEFKMNLLAKSCFCPGIIALLGNLVKSAGEDSLDKVQHAYLKEYLSGMGHEIYRTKLSPQFVGKRFVEIADTVYKQYRGIIFCLEIQYEGETIVVLNPGNYEIPEKIKYNTYVYIICEDKEVADKVTQHNITEEEFERLYNPDKAQMEVNEGQNLELVRSPDWVEQGDLEEFEHQGEAETVNMFALEYAVMEEPQNIMSITKISIQHSQKVRDHIVVCGIHSALYSFILPLRASYLKELMYVVILNPEPPSQELWGQISIFPNLIYIRGSPLVNEDLVRAGIKNAKKAVIMDSGKANLSVSDVPDAGNDRMVDAESIFIYKAIKKANPNLQIMIELVYPSNIEFLEPRSTIKEDMRLAKQTDEFNYEYVSLYASGEVYISAIIDTLTCQSYYNPHIVTILKQLLSSGQSNTYPQKFMGICEGADMRQSNFWQIPVPEDLQNKTFGELFYYLATQRSLIALGLYRLPGATDNERPYVYTNPPENVKLSAQDRVFVLGSSMPDDLKEAAPSKLHPIKIEEPGQGSFPENDDNDDQLHHNSPAGKDEQDDNEKSPDANERIESNIGMGTAIDQVKNYRLMFQKRLDALEQKLKRQEEMLTNSIRESLYSEITLARNNQEPREVKDTYN